MAMGSEPGGLVVEGGRGGARSGYVTSPPQAHVPHLGRDQDYLLPGAVDCNKVLPVAHQGDQCPVHVGGQ